MKAAKRLAAPLALALALACLWAPAAQASFGLGEFDVTFDEAGGSAQVQAGTHPYAMTTSLAVNAETNAEGTFPEGQAKDIEVAQIPGFIGDQTAVPQCSTLDFLTQGAVPGNSTACANSTAVGTVNLKVSEGAGVIKQSAPVYNLVPVPGAAARLGFSVASTRVTISVGLSESPPYELIAHTRNVSQILEFFSAKLTLWGVPADPAHDSLRGTCFWVDGTSTGESCSAGVNPAPSSPSPRLRGPAEDHL